MRFFYRKTVCLAGLLLSLVLSVNAQKIVVAQQSTHLIKGSQYEADVYFIPKKTPKKKWSDFQISYKQLYDPVFVNLPTTSSYLDAARLNFLVDTRRFDVDGRAEEKFIVRVTYKEGKRIAEFVDTFSYHIRMAIIQDKNTGGFMYLNCENKLILSVPDLGENYQSLSISTQGGTSIKGEKPGNFIIVPNSPKVRIVVNSSINDKEVFIGKLNYQVSRIPMPVIQLAKYGKRISIKKGFSKDDLPRSLTLKVSADRDFKKFFPNDANYEMKQAELQLLRKGQTIGQVDVGEHGTFDLKDLVTQMKVGDVIQIQVKRVMRTNFDGKVKAVKGLGEITYNLLIHA